MDRCLIFSDVTDGWDPMRGYPPVCVGIFKEKE